MILQRVPEWFWNAPVWVKKPFFSCCICMVPWWGSLIIIVFGSFTHYWPHPLIWIIELLTAGGINVIASSILKPDPDDHISGGVQQ